MRKQFIILFACIFAFAACTGPSNGDTVQTNTEKNTNPVHKAPKSVSPETKAKLDNLRSHADALIDSRSAKEGPYSMLVVGYWHYKFLFEGKGKPKPFDDGYWIKFNDDFNYQYGQFEETHGGGRYHFTFDEMKLIMKDDHPNKSPQEWRILTKEDVMIFEGSEYFGNNPRQMKTEKSMSLPERV